MPFLGCLLTRLRLNSRASEPGGWISYVKGRAIFGPLFVPFPFFFYFCFITCPTVLQRLFFLHHECERFDIAGFVFLVLNKLL